MHHYKHDFLSTEYWLSVWARVKESLRSGFYKNWQYSLTLGTLDHFTLNWLSIFLPQKAQNLQLRN